ncbi:LysR family transcriptional regulator [Ferruginivarius sediminum]|uniref:LysR family transcriptional regulator n=1 Tax=Ferruginivarius sediminum TaxID=2661937 RepID=A0A369T7N3_9PROT|nr:LysR family transcriptional regulator [Ferruginivarius sediminum]RDD61349.1 LysR family transcriptional regulator [Ferruginivarius sediminum]
MQSLRRAMPSPTSLFAFKATARLGSFTLTAEELNASQAAVSAGIRRLEQDLGTTLFTRANRRTALTENGRKFFGDVSIGLTSEGSGGALPHRPWLLRRLAASPAAEGRYPGHSRLAGGGRQH